MSTATISVTRSVQRQPVQRHPVQRRPARQPSARPVATRTELVASVRLTGRGRLVVLMAVLAIALVAFMVLGGSAVSSDQAHHAAPHTVVVGGGQTLWDIASRIAPGEDPRSVIADIVDLNALPDAGSIRVGQELDVPQY